MPAAALSGQCGYRHWFIGTLEGGRENRVRQGMERPSRSPWPAASTPCMLAFIVTTVTVTASVGPGRGKVGVHLPGPRKLLFAMGLPWIANCLRLSTIWNFFTTFPRYLWVGIMLQENNLPVSICCQKPYCQQNTPESFQ